jgi:hypothetical protein
MIVPALHWGPNMRLSPRPRYRPFAHAAIDGGVDVVHGHSAHIVQGVEIYKGRPILYDTGNLLDDYWKFPFLPDDVSFVFLLDLQAGGAQRLRMVPIGLHPAPLRIATGRDRPSIIDRLRRGNAAVRTELVECADGLEVAGNLSVWSDKLAQSDATLSLFGLYSSGQQSDTPRRRSRRLSGRQFFILQRTTMCWTAPRKC